MDAAAAEAFGILGLLLFVGVFVLVTIRTLRRSAQGWERERRLPLDEAAPADGAAGTDETDPVTKS